MTDELIKRLRSQVETACDEAADAIEALQGEVERYAVCQVQLEEDRDIYKQQRDALQAKLDELQRLEPVGFVAPDDLKTLREGYPATVVMLPGHKRTEPLYAAPKALEPEPLIKFRHGCKWCGKAKCAAGCYGITKGAPT